MFPNMSPLARQPRTLAVWHPRGPHQTEVWRWYLVDADAPAEVKDFLRHYYIRYSGPSGLTEQDDMENWNYAHKASRGTIARQFPYNYEMGLGRATRDFEDHGLRLPGDHHGRAARRGQREQPARLLHALAPVHGGGELEGPRRVSGDLARLLLKEEIEQFLYREAELLDDAAVRGVADALRRGRAVLHADAAQRPSRRARARVHPGRRRRQLVRRGQGHAHPAGEADPHRHPLGRGAALADLPHDLERAGGDRAPPARQPARSR